MIWNVGACAPDLKDLAGFVGMASERFVVEVKVKTLDAS
jgi:hypothetical protein